MKKERKWRAAGVVCLLLAVVFFASYFYARMSPQLGKGLRLGQEKIAVVKIEGTLTEASEILEEIAQYKERSDIKAIVLRVDSPGGAVVPAQEIYEEVKKLRKDKRVLASLGNVAASGGYYVACAANEIIANPGTITGSIGVISEYSNIQKLMDKIGLKSLVIKGGLFKDVGNPMREMTKEERRLLQDLVDNIHDQFIRAVAEGRHMDVKAVEALADGRVYTGEQAKANGLIDGLGNLQDALERAGQLAEIKGKPVIIYPEEKRRRIWKRLFRDASEWIGHNLLEEQIEESHGFVKIR